jgi:hypothetical protein
MRTHSKHIPFQTLNMRRRPVQFLAWPLLKKCSRVTGLTCPMICCLHARMKLRSYWKEGSVTWSNEAHNLFKNWGLALATCIKSGTHALRLLYLIRGVVQQGPRLFQKPGLSTGCRAHTHCVYHNILDTLILILLIACIVRTCVHAHQPYMHKHVAAEDHTLVGPSV